MRDGISSAETQPRRNAPLEAVKGALQWMNEHVQWKPGINDKGKDLGESATLLLPAVLGAKNAAESGQAEMVALNGIVVVTEIMRILLTDTKGNLSYMNGLAKGIVNNLKQ